MSLTESQAITELPAFPKPHAGGRPSSYKREYCEEIIELAKEGKSEAQIASTFSVSKQTLKDWANQYPEFSEALSRAKTEEQSHLETVGYNGLDKQGFNDRLWRTMMQARFREDYTERQIVTAETGTDAPGQDERQLARAVLAILRAAAPQVTDKKGLSPRAKADMLELAVSETLERGGKP